MKKGFLTRSPKKTTLSKPNATATATATAVPDADVDAQAKKVIEMARKGRMRLKRRLGEGGEGSLDDVKDIRAIDMMKSLSAYDNEPDSEILTEEMERVWNDDKFAVRTTEIDTGENLSSSAFPTAARVWICRVKAAADENGKHDKKGGTIDDGSGDAGDEKRHVEPQMAGTRVCVRVELTGGEWDEDDFVACLPAAAFPDPLPEQFCLPAPGDEEDEVESADTYGDGGAGTMSIEVVGDQGKPGRAREGLALARDPYEEADDLEYLGPPPGKNGARKSSSSSSSGGGDKRAQMVHRCAIWLTLPSYGWTFRVALIRTRTTLTGTDLKIYLYFISYL
jgi:hypothetical protein